MISPQNLTLRPGDTAASNNSLKIGVLALQGAFLEHANMMRRLGATPVEVRLPRDFDYALAGRKTKKMPSDWARLGVTGTDGKVVQLDDGSSVPCSTLVWTAGVKASPLADVLARHLGDGTLTRGGRVVVTPELTVPGHPEIAVVGDLAATPDGSGGVLPQLAPVAIQGGRLVAANLVAELAGQPSEPFHYVDKGTMATVGRRNAVAQLPGRLRFSGTPGWLAWLGLHLIMLIGFRNRANVMVNWAWNYVTYDRASRLIVGDDDHPARPSGRPMPTDPDR